MTDYSNLHPYELNELLSQSVIDFAISFDNRLSYFTQETNEEEHKFIDHEINFFESCLHNLKNSDELRVLDNKTMGINDIFSLTHRKLKYLNSKKQIIQDEKIQIKASDNIDVSSEKLAHQTPVVFKKNLPRPNRYLIILDESKISEKEINHKKLIKQDERQIKEVTSIKNQLSITTKENKKEIILTPTSFKEIFLVKKWQVLINVLGNLEPPLIDKKLNFIGSSRGGKGIICSWISTLQSKGKIKSSIKRQVLSSVLNNEIKGLELGKDGSTFSKINIEYQKKWEKKLLKLAGLLP